MTRSTDRLHRPAEPADTDRPMPAGRLALGVDLVPRPRRFGAGLLADTLAGWRHSRRVRLRTAA